MTDESDYGAWCEGETQMLNNTTLQSDKRFQEMERQRLESLLLTEEGSLDA